MSPYLLNFLNCILFKGLDDNILTVKLSGKIMVSLTNTACFWWREIENNKTNLCLIQLQMWEFYDGAFVTPCYITNRRQSCVCCLCKWNYKRRSWQELRPSHHVRQSRHDISLRSGLVRLKASLICTTPFCASPSHSQLQLPFQTRPLVELTPEIW